MKFIERMVGLLFRPKETMKDIIRRPRIIEAVVIVFAYVLLSVVSSIILSSHTNMVINDPQLAGLAAPESMKPFMIVFNMIVTFTMGITLWPITAGVLHIASRVFGGTGRFIPDVMTAIGYTYLVKIPFSIIAILLLLLTPPSTMTINPPPSAMAGQNATTYSFADNSIYSGGNKLLTVMGDLMSIVGTVLASLLGMMAIKYGENLRTRDAVIVVGVPLLIYMTIPLSLLLYVVT